MNINFEFIYSNIVCTGIIFGIGAIGLGLIYKYLKFPDFTTIGSISAGSIAMVTMAEYHITLGFIIGILIGGFLGFVTFVQIRFIKIPPILAGIITWVFSFSVIYFLSGGDALISSEKSEQTFDIIISPNDRILNFLIIGGIAILISYLISQVFKRKYGLYILAMLGTENFLNYRHKKVNTAYFVLLVFGNAIISLAGSLLAVTNKNAHIDGVPEFLVIALSGYVIAHFLINLISKNDIGDYANKDNKPSKWKVTAFLMIRDKLSLNDEHPIKIFWFLIFVVFGATIVQIIFQLIDTNGSNFTIAESYFYKSILFFGFLSLMQVSKFFSTYKHNKQ